MGYCIKEKNTQINHPAFIRVYYNHGPKWESDGDNGLGFAEGTVLMRWNLHTLSLMQPISGETMSAAFAFYPPISVSLFLQLSIFPRLPTFDSWIICQSILVKACRISHKQDVYRDGDFLNFWYITNFSVLLRNHSSVWQRRLVAQQIWRRIVLFWSIILKCLCCFPQCCRSLLGSGHQDITCHKLESLRPALRPITCLEHVNQPEDGDC